MPLQSTKMTSFKNRFFHLWTWFLANFFKISLVNCPDFDPKPRFWAKKGGKNHFFSKKHVGNISHFTKITQNKRNEVHKSSIELIKSIFWLIFLLFSYFPLYMSILDPKNHLFGPKKEQKMIFWRKCILGICHISPK